MTPPLDEEAEREESRLLEAQSREELEGDGCPPCYPQYLGVPLQNIPEKFKAIIAYWKAFPGTGDVVLRAQLSDWQNFRSFQTSIRQYYRQKPFSEFAKKVRNRRAKHNLRGDVHLQYDVNQQSRLESWTEFQDYHLQLHEGLEKDLKELDGLRTEAEHTGSRGFDRAVKAYQQRLEYAERKLQQHDILLQWTEQERMVMDTGYSVLAEKDNDWDASLRVIRATCGGNRRKRQAATLAVLNNVKISKAKPKKRKGQLRKRMISGPGSTVEAVPPQSTLHQEPKRQQAKPQPNKTEMPADQCRLQRVSKVARFTQANMKSPAKRPCGARHKRCPSKASSSCWQGPRWSQLTCETIITRSGRVSRRPVRWAPE